MRSVNYFGYQVFENGDVIGKRYRCKLKYGAKRGYYYFTFCHNRTQKALKIHRLIAELFIPNPENKPEINHKNGIKSDNRVENLEWVTTKENCIHAVKNGLRISLKGKDHVQSIPVYQYDLQGNYINKFSSSGEAERLTGIWHTNICKNTLNQRPTAGGYIWRKAI